jgi:hypothetical protein
MGLEDHTRGAESALKGIVFHESPLEGLKLSVLGEPFNGPDLSAFDGPDGRLA